ncbi:YaaL family protein [Limosilactobacillus mucosae]|uniref:YaaL family protein n=1 Tax=Limosilactobacillus mucosae TaxID=97478 RepID=A0AAJ1HRB4_LIMMU|nr:MULTISPECIES: YaaL family protein [Limosilactobacillus]MDD6865216.1 YaaL family protein [Lactobacillus sp.]MDC2829261.1 YaaL family protein [Limosilactobacillus mucosae]MDC2836944.1 YaaL family protein [Limosilactobacillus mucosae]MDC2839083.1 YaaL family protein [Limosilactobacillus mucosae]MDC2841514.1 YaaL family protein [Limosilactobacillus mucosae]
MFFKHRNPHAVEELGNQNLLELIYNVKDSWDHAKETEHAVYEGQVDNELYSRTKLQEQKYLYLYGKARRSHLHGYLNDSVIKQ